MEGQAFPFRYDVSTLLRVCSILLQLVVLDFRPRGCHVVEGVLPLNGRACDPASFDASPMLRHPSCNMFSSQQQFPTPLPAPSPQRRQVEVGIFATGMALVQEHKSLQYSTFVNWKFKQPRNRRQQSSDDSKHCSSHRKACYTHVLLRQNQPVVESPRALLPHLRRLAGLETNKERVLQRLNSPFNARLLALVRSAHHPRPTWLGK